MPKGKLMLKGRLMVQFVYYVIQTQADHYLSIQYITLIIRQMDINQLSTLLSSLEHAVAENTTRLKAQWVEMLTQSQNDINLTNSKLLQTAQFILKLRQINDEQRLNEFEDILVRIVNIALFSKFLYGLDAIKLIFSLKTDFYQYNNVDRNLDFPIGRTNPLPKFIPTINEQCDVIRPYVTCTSPSFWSRCLVLGINQYGVASVKFSNVNDITSVKTVFAPLGSRSHDHDWRMGLKVGDLVDAQDNKLIWILSTISDVIDNNGVKEVKVSFRYYCAQGDKKDQNGQYFGWGSTNDQVLNVMSPRIQLPNKMHKKLDYFASTLNNQTVIEDSYDILYEQDFKQKPFYAVLRTNFNKSQTFLHLYNIFVSAGGFKLINEMLANNDNAQLVCNMFWILWNTTYMLPRMVIQDILPNLNENIRRWCLNNTKVLTLKNYEAIFPTITIISLRYMSFSQLQNYTEEIKKQLLLLLLPQNLDKQLIAIRIMYDLIKPIVPFTTQTKQNFIQYLQKNRVFEKVYQTNNTHDQVLSRTNEFLKFYFDNNIITFKELQHLWKIVPISDPIGRSVLQKLLGDVSPEMHHQHVEYLVNKILQIGYKQLTVGNLGLLKVLKTKVYSKISIMKMLEYIWDLITINSGSIKVAVEMEAQFVFKVFISSLSDHQIKFHLLKDMIKRLRQTRIIKKELSVIADYLKSFKENRESEEISPIPVTIQQIVKYLKETQDIYTLLMGILEMNSNTEHTKTSIQLLSYLLSIDNTINSGEVIKSLYLKLQNKQLVLNIAKQFSSSSVFFAAWFFQQLSLAGSLSNLSVGGFESVKQLFISLNQHYKYINVQFGKLTGKEKQQVRKRFIHVMIPPLNLIGITFLDRLFKQLKDNVTTHKLVEFIVFLTVNIDESLFDQTIEIRKSILRNIALEIQSLSSQQYTDKTKEHLQKNILLIKELMSETETKGLFDLIPHIEIVEGDYYHLKVMNNIPNSKGPKQIPITINQNSCLWRLQTIIANILNQDPLSISIQKAPSVFGISNKVLGTTFANLPIWKQQTLHCERAKSSEIPRSNLLNDTGSDISHDFELIVRSWFDKYKDGQDALSLQNLHKFNSDFSLKQVQENVSLEMMTKYDTNSDMNLTFDDFKRIFYDKSVSNLNSMWKFLNLNRYINNLKKSGQKLQQLTVEALPRYILADEKVFAAMFSILKNNSFQPVHSLIFDLICMLPTNKRVQKIMETNVQILNNCNNSYQYNYLLDILLKKLKAHQYQFYMVAINKGIELIIEKINSYNFEPNGISSLTVIDQTVVQKILKIINMYCNVDLMLEDVIYSLSQEKPHQLTLGDLNQVLTKKVVSSPQDYRAKNITMREMNITINYQKIAAVCQKVLEAVIKSTSKQPSRYLFSQLHTLSYICCFKKMVSMEVLTKGLLSQSMMIRRLVSNSLYLNVIMNSETEQAVISYLLNNIPQKNTFLCTEFFQLLSLLIARSIDRIDAYFNLSAIVENIINKLIHMNTEEKRNSQFSENKVLKGQLSIVNTILKKKPEICLKMSDYKIPLMRKCLFFYNPIQRIEALAISAQHLKKDTQQQLFEDYPSCKSADNRKLLLQTIVLLQNANKSSNFISNLILPILEQLPEKLRRPSSKSYTVGLYNFGSTCYMNSMLQMLGRVKPFRNGLLMAHNQASKISSELQRLYSYLFFSQRQDYVPQKLLSSFNPPINPMVQQDTTQFLNFLFNHLQQDFKNTCYKHLLDSCFQGTTTLQMICHKCGRKKQKQQSFYCYPVRVKDRINLYEALEHSHEGEVIGDWSCQFCNQKSDMTKRNILNNIPNVMFIHLQRIVFNFDLYINTKIHTHLQFPIQLNIQPYTKEGVELREAVGLEYIKSLPNNEAEAKRFQERCLHGLTKDDYLLQLMGVIIHSGTADVGHYYSIVKDDRQSQSTNLSKNCEQNKTKPPEIGPTSSELSWIKLDDSKVTYTSRNMMFEEGFGGSTKNDWGFQQSKNAYVLVYEKKKKNPIHAQPSILNNQQLSKFQQKPNSNLIDYNSFKTYNLEKYYKEVWLDNHNLMLETHLIGDECGKSYIKFLEDLLQSSKQPQRAEVISQVLFKIIPHVGQAGKLMEIYENTMPSYALFKKYLGDQKRILQMLFHNDKATRLAMAKYISTTVTSCLKHQYSQSSQHVTTFLNYLLSLLNTEVAKNWLKCQSYFYIILKLLYESVNIQPLYVYFTTQQLIAQLIDFVLGKDSPLKLSPKKHDIGNKHAYVDFNHGVYAILFLLQRSFLFINKNLEIQVIQENQKFHLSDNQAIALSSMEFYSRMLKNRIAAHQLASIIHRLSIQNFGFTEAIIRLILNILTQCKGGDIGFGVAQCVFQLLIIQDIFMYQRAQMLLGCGSQGQVRNDNRIYSIEQQIFSFNSTIENLFPAQPLFYYCYCNRTTFPMLVLHLLHAICVATSNHVALMDFIIKQPSINYLHLRYYQWIRTYVSAVKNLIKVDKNNEAAIDQKIDEIRKCLDTFDQYVVNNNIKMDTLIAGSVVEDKLEYRIAIPGSQNVFQQLREYQVYCIKSLPSEDSTTNLSLAPYLSQYKLKSKNIDPSSNILLIMRPSASATKKQKKSKKIEKTWAVEQETNIQPMFAEFQDVPMKIQEKKQEIQVQEQIQKEQSKDNAEEIIEDTNYPVQTINLQEITTTNFFRQLIIENSSDKDIWIVVQFSTVNLNETNCLLPTKCSCRVRAGYRQILLVMNKYDYNNNWHQFFYTVKIENGDKYRQKDMNTYCYRLYGQPPKYIIESERTPPTSMTKIPQPEAPKTQENISEQFQQKVCPVCTFLNLPMIAECQACGSSLLQI